MGASSGLIIAFVVAVWAAYFVPLVLRRYDEAGRNASVEEAGATGRVIAPTTPEPAEELTPAAPVAQRPQLDRPAARLAARRRRRTLLTLLGLLALTGVLVVASIVPTPVIVAPVVLIVAWLVACRVQVRGELGLSTPRISVPHRTRDETTEAPARAFEDEDTMIVSGQFEDVDPGRAHVMEDVPLSADALDDQIVIAVPSVSTAGEALWDPLPITVPTYVTKPRAGRTVRTIDFNAPGTWTSGHVEGEDTTMPQRTDDSSASGDERRAVNG